VVANSVDVETGSDVTSLASFARRLLDDAVSGNEGRLTRSGSLAVQTGTFTGRSPQDKYIVREPANERSIWWDANRPMEESVFERLEAAARAHLSERKTWKVRLGAGSDPAFQYPVDLTTEQAWVALFSYHLFVRDPQAENEHPITILHAPSLAIDSKEFGTRSSTVIALHLSRRTIVIAGTGYAGEVKKSVFTMLQYLLPERGVVTMHCSAVKDAEEGTTLFFGLSGTGKTTLSNSPGMHMVGDDEHGWSDSGIFNLEAGCYAKAINLDAEREPYIYAATTHEGAVLENVVLDNEGNPDFADASLTENTRAAYPIEWIPNVVPSGTGGHPRHIIFLTADATGVLPPVSRLTVEQALGVFLLGYTSKVAGTELGVSDPEPTFSPAFGSPFLPLPPARYAEMLHDKMQAHHPSLWLVNTGWTGGTVAGGAKRISLDHTRSIIRAIVDGALADGQFQQEPVFGLAIPLTCDDVPANVLMPAEAWSSRDTYLREAERLKQTFQQRASEMGITPEWSEWLRHQ
jgi:phosphoenolpyruvate carboxykinase (ATP)